MTWLSREPAAFHPASLTTDRPRQVQPSEAAVFTHDGGTRGDILRIIQMEDNYTPLIHPFYAHMFKVDELWLSA